MTLLCLGMLKFSPNSTFSICDLTDLYVRFANIGAPSGVVAIGPSVLL